MSKKLLLLMAVLGIALQASEAGAHLRPTCSSTLCDMGNPITPCRCPLSSHQPDAPANCTNWQRVCWGIPP